MTIRVLRVYHGARDLQHRARERALVSAGVDVTLAAPSQWPDAGGERVLSPGPFSLVELPVRRAGDVNRHVHLDEASVRRLIADTQPDVLDIHEEPFSAVARQWLGAAAGALPVVMYAAQNIDKRYPPPFSHYEHAAYQRVDAFYPCSHQAASVLRGKGFGGVIEVLPLGYDDAVYEPGTQSLDAEEIVLMLVGRLVPEKGVDHAIRVLARVNADRPARLVVCGEGPEAVLARRVASALGVADRVDFTGWLTGPDLASAYKAAHVVLIPSRATQTWVEQFGRVIVEAQASGAVVAGYACGAIPEVAGDAALVVPIGDLDRLVEGVVRIVSNREDFDRRRDAGRRLAATRTWHAVAVRQAALYQTVLGHRRARLERRGSPRRRRAAARAEFGPTAPTSGGDRPFALPVLRNGGGVARALATAIDAAAELASRRP
jgi:glycosyltransferase involved in cell wall biosynthesis